MSRSRPQDTNEMTILDITKRDTRKNGSAPPGGGENTVSVGLTVISGSDVDFGKHFNVSGGSLVIGRDKDSRISLDDAKISKSHCEISIIRDWEMEQVMIRDLNSTNGTYINGKRVRQATLKAGDKIGIGDTVLRFSYNDELEEEYHARLFSFAATDSLTGLYNRRYIINELENQVRIARRNERALSLVILDIDNFKRINDTFGHLAGDDYLKRFSFVLTRCLREQDICGRVGGEEFLIILPETPLEGAFQLAERVRTQVSQTEVSHQNGIIKTTVCGGVSQYGQDAVESRPLFDAADRALKKAKTTGKNRVIRADETGADDS